MPSSLVECIPNFSEARRPEVVEAIIKTIQDVPGVQLLDRHSDMDHNRTVVTFVGDPTQAAEAAFQAIRKAAELIDLNHHTGEHPRIGATDVVPFVPINNITMMECVELARNLGRRVGQELNIPVYLYEDAATRPERQNLENIRKGQYEGLKTEIETHPERSPDFGPAHLGTAGATVIGARQPLIAFNVYLTTDDIRVAQKIAKAVRNSSGGIHFVKALGLLVDGRAQVSMNLTNYRQSPIARVVEFVRREAQRYGVNIHHTELVGLTPQESLTEAAAWYLQMDGFTSDQILEQRLFEAVNTKPAETQPAADEFISALAAGTPTPGGGSAAAYVGAMAAALVAMVAQLTIGKKKYAEVEPLMKSLLEKAQNSVAVLSQAVARDSEAFTKVMEAIRLPKDTPDQAALRETAVEKAMKHAAEVPLETAAAALDVMELATQAASYGNKNAISDAGSSCALARACIRSAGYNVRTNCSSLKDQKIVDGLIKKLKQIEEKAAEYEKEMERILSERGGMSF